MKQKQLFKQPTRDASHELPCGVLIDGELVKTVTITPLTIEDRKNVADKPNKNNTGKIITNLLNNRILALGEEQPTPVQLGKMLLFDREYVMLRLFELSNPGKPLNVAFECKKCGETFEVDIPTDELDIVKMTDEAQKKIDTKTGVRYWDYKNEEYGVSGRIRYIDGATQEALSPALRKNIVEGEQKLMVKMILEWFGPEGSVGGLTLPEIQTFPLALVNDFEDQLVKQKCGPIFKKKVVCPECDKSMEGVFDITSFLFKG